MSNRILGVLLGIAVLLVAVLTYFIFSVRKLPVRSDSSSAAATTAATSLTATTATSAAPMYILGEWEGKLALFVPPSASPDKVYDVYVSSLPRDEQVKLASGISIYDEQTLSGLLEDYTS